MPTTSKTISTEKVCSICGTHYTGYGNDARPFNDGRCCDICNSLVIAARSKSYSEQRKLTPKEIKAMKAQWENCHKGARD